jgi:hypothetical protein
MPSVPADDQFTDWDLCKRGGRGRRLYNNLLSVLLTAEGDAPCSFNDRANNDITKTDRLSEHEIVSGPIGWKDRTSCNALTFDAAQSVGR